MPQTAQEFREQAPHAFMGSLTTLDVDRPYPEVSKTFQATAPECLSVSVRTVSHTRTSSSNVLATYKPTVVVGSTSLPWSSSLARDK